MFKVNIQIDVKNASEVISKEKGQLAGAMASMFMSEEQKRAKVEEIVRAEVIKALEKNIKDELQKKGVLASVSIG